MKKFILLLFLILAHQAVQAGYYFNINTNCRQAYEAIMCLRLNDAKILLDKEKGLDPKNAAPYFIENYIDFFSAFISEKRPEFEKLKKEMDNRIKIIESADENSPFYLFAQAQINLQVALVRFKFKEYATGAYEIRKSYKLLEKNNQRFPQFKGNLLYLGLLHCLMGTVPEEYRWIGSLVGLSGTIQQGMMELNQIANTCEGCEYEYLYPEAMLTLALLDTYLQKDPVSARNTINKLTQTFKKPSMLVSFLLVTTAIHSSNANEALQALSQKPLGNEYLSIEYTDYQMGQAKLSKLDKDAYLYFTKYINEFEGESFIKAAYQKIAWCYLVQGDVDKYRQNMQLCLKNGYTNIDEDRQAMMEAKSGEIPNVFLLRTRLLFDGGYYNKALAVLSAQPIDKLSKSKDKLEYTYRQARIYDKMGIYDKAIPLYDETINKGEKMTYYFAANSALELGLLYERQQNKEKARLYFQKCLTMRNHEYQNGLDQKAKAGLGRLK